LPRNLSDGECEIECERAAFFTTKRSNKANAMEQLAAYGTRFTNSNSVAAINQGFIAVLSLSAALISREFEIMSSKCCVLCNAITGFRRTK
jgi:hypothetical protein